MKAALRIVVSLGVAGLLLALLVRFGGLRPDNALATLVGLPGDVLAIAVGTHVCVYVLRALRFRLLLPPEGRPGFGRLLVLSSAHNMASYVLPAKTGEASWILYLKVHCGVRASTGLASLLVSRMLDGAVLCSGVALSCLWISRSHEYDAVTFMGHDSRVFLGATGAVLVALMLVFGMLAVRADWLVGLVAVPLRFLRVHHWTLGERVVDKLVQAAYAIQSARRGHRLGLAALVTVPVWLGIFAFYDILGQAMGLPEGLSFAEVVFGASLGVMANLLPVNGVAGVGTQEGGWLVGFGILGISGQVAGEASLGAHALQLIDVVVIGLCAHVAMAVMPRVAAAPEEAVLASEAELPRVD